MKMSRRYGGNSLKLIAFGLFAIILLIVYWFYHHEKMPDEQRYQYDKISTTNTESLRETAQDFSGKETPLPIAIDAKTNFKDYSKRFYVPNDTDIHIFAVGEAADYRTNPFLFRPWDNDGVEFFFDMQNEKNTVFDFNKGNRQYRILWKSLKVDGQNLNLKGVKFRESDPSNKTYLIDLLLPWKSLGFVTPHPGLKFGFDATIIDCDNGSEKAKIDWHNKLDDDWKATNHYGTILLIRPNEYRSDTTEGRALQRVKGHSFSELTPFYQYHHVTVGYVTDPSDLSGKFRAEWDYDNLYLQVLVTDNIKTMANALFDYGWIENPEGEMIWAMKNTGLRYAGGAKKNKFIDTCIRLKKGHYLLKYHTDESHSPAKWDDAPPDTKFYGIRITSQSKTRE